MYMEAYGNVGSVADNIIKSAAHTLIANKIADEKIEKANQEKAMKQAQKKSFEGEPQIDVNNTNSDVGVSSQNSGGVGSMADPTIVRDMNAVSRQKAMESLNQKIEDLQARNIYLEDRLGKRLLRKGK